MIKEINEALGLLPAKFGANPAVRKLMCAIAFQESDGQYRRQKGNGPARGLWQFEKGNPKSRGGVTGLMMHDAVSGILRDFAKQRGVEFTADAIWAALETDDVLAAGVARLMLWTAPGPIPVTQVESWHYYEDCWRPGKPRPDDWPRSWTRATAEVSQ